MSLTAVIGLGNPGAENYGARHNLGFAVVDRVAEKKRMTFKPGKENYRESVDPGGRFILIKPTTFMNESGRAVAQVKNRYNVPPGDMLIVYDDMDLPVGTIRFRESGGSGGHHGMDSIIYQIETDDFPRLRLGINSELRRGDDADFVLSSFGGEEEGVVDRMVEAGAQGVIEFIYSDIKICMNKYNTKAAITTGI